MKIEIKKNGLDKYQVWREHRILEPGKLDWFPRYMANSNFMYFDSLKQAEEEIKKVLLKEDIKTIKVYEVEEK